MAALALPFAAILAELPELEVIELRFGLDGDTDVVGVHCELERQVPGLPPGRVGADRAVDVAAVGPAATARLGSARRPGRLAGLAEF